MQRERLRMKTKLAFGVGAIAEAGCYIAFSSFNMLFYNNVLGLSGTLCGLAVTIALVLDAINDPAIGFLSDRWKSRLGRRHPFLFAAPIPVAITFYCIYNPPEGWTGIPLFLWFTTFTLLFRQAMSLYQVPHLALGAELTKDYHERSVVMSYNALFQSVGGISAAFFGWTWIRAAGGATSPAGYGPLGAGIAIAACFIIFASAQGTRDQIPRLPQPPADQPKATLRGFFQETLDCLKNKSYATLLLGLLFLSATLGTRETIAAYMNLFFWGLDEGQIRLFPLASIPAYLLAFAFTARAHRRFGKRAAIIAAVCIVVFTATYPIMARIMGAIPENGTGALFRTLLVFHGSFYFGIAVLTISVMSALADVADEHELVTGRRQEGSFFAARAFFAQLASGLGHLIAGVALDVIGFVPGAKPGTVPDEVLFRLGVLDGPIASLPALFAIVFYARYKIDEARHAEILRELAIRRAASAPPAAAASAQGVGSEPITAVG